MYSRPFTSISKQARIIFVMSICALFLFAATELSAQSKVPAFKLKSRKETALNTYPCMDCHQDITPNGKIRTLEEDHDSIHLKHGDGKIWCTTCHDLQNKNNLISVNGESIDFDESHLLCGQCHFERLKDWTNGAHGKRIGNWQGERLIQNCTECHGAHAPTIRPKKPDSAPQKPKLTLQK